MVVTEERIQAIEDDIEALSMGADMSARRGYVAHVRRIDQTLKRLDEGQQKLVADVGRIVKHLGIPE